MKNIMLIVVATLTIAAANATTNWGQIHHVQIINNTPVELEFRTMIDSSYFTLKAGESRFAPDIRTGSMYVGWGVDDTGAGPIVKTQSFDDSQQTGNLSATTLSISGNLGLGQAWALGNVSYNDVLVLTGTTSGNNMQLTATRTRGVVVYRTDDHNTEWADVFCVDTQVEFGLLYDDTSGRCPPNETKVIMADNTQISDNTLDYYDPNYLKQHILTICTYNDNSCHDQYDWNSAPTGSIVGVYIDSFESVPYSSSHSQLNLWLEFEFGNY